MIKAPVSKIKEFFRRKQMAYVQTFDIKGPYQRVVLEDLAKFCRAHEPTFAKDQRTSDLLEGRREVWLRIQNYLNLSSDELYALHSIKSGGENG